MHTQISIDTPAGKIEGEFDPKFAAVYDAFVNNFLAQDEVGASCAVYLDGKPVLDLWGGRKTRNGPAWTRDTISMVFSSTKGAMALCAHMLADRGMLDLDAPITNYWPEFGCGGKESARVSMALDHTAGVPHVRDEIKPRGFWDYDYMVERVATEPAFWTPGTRQGYHGITMAWTVGELIRRAAKQRFGRFFDDEVAKPLGLDFWIGLPDQFEDSVSPMILAEPDAAWIETKFIQTALTTTDTPTALFMRDFAQFEPNSRACRAAEVGSANGMANARSLARMYAPLANGGRLNEVRLVGSETLTRMGRVSAATVEDATLMIPVRFALGFMKSTDNRRIPNTVNSSLLLTEAAFGHVGAGGSIGFADPECRLAFGYSMNRMGTGLLLNPRGQLLIDATYRALGYRTDKGGVWTT